MNIRLYFCFSARKIHADNLLSNDFRLKMADHFKSFTDFSIFLKITQIMNTNNNSETDPVFQRIS